MIYNNCPQKCTKCHSRFFIVGKLEDVNFLLCAHAGRFDGIAYYEHNGLHNLIVEYKRECRPLHNNICINTCGVAPLIGVWSSILQSTFIKEEWSKMTHIYGFRSCGYKIAFPVQPLSMENWDTNVILE